MRGGVAAFTLGFSAPAFLTDIARAQGRSRRNLVVLYLSGGNDGLSTLIPYTDGQYYARRPNLAIPAANDETFRGTRHGGYVEVPIVETPPRWQRRQSVAIQEEDRRNVGMIVSPHVSTDEQLPLMRR